MIPSKICEDCNKNKLLIPQFWIRDAKSDTGLKTKRCKACDNIIRREYVKNTQGKSFYEITGHKFSYGKPR
jgi:hypothetical protein